MSTFNTTYNFNQGNMNFGQALMYGAFGSLTGGMGGYGMGMSPFGMGGSVFSMMGMGGFGCSSFGGFGMGGCGFGMSDNQYVGGLLGLMGSQFLLGGVTQAIKNHKAAKAEAPENKINDVVSSAEEYLDVLNAEGSSTTYTLDNFSSASVETKYSDEVTKANNAITARLEELNGKLNGDYADSKKPVKQENESDSDFNARLTKWEQEKAAIEAEKSILLSKTDNKNELVKTLLNAQDALNKREDAIDAAKNALAPIKSEYQRLQDEIQANKEAKILDDADGNWLNRARKSKIDNYTGKDQDGNVAVATKAEIRGAFNQFINAQKAGKTEDQKRYGAILANMHKICKSENSNNFNDFEDAYKTLKISDYE